MSTVEEYTNWFYSYSDLPMEIIIHIFNFLGFSDQLAAGSTCSRWYSALYNKKFVNNTVLRFEKKCLSDSSAPAKYFLRGERPFREIHFDEVNFENVKAFLTRLGNSVTSVTFEKVDLSEKQLVNMVNRLPQIRELSISNCSSLFLTGSLLESYYGADGNKSHELECFSSLKKLSLHCNQYLTDADLMRLVNLIKKLEILDISDCHIACHSSIYQRFYPGDSNDIAKPNESIFTFKFIRRVIWLHRAHLSELNLSNTLIGGPSLQSLSELEDGGLHLLCLKLANCRQVNSTGLKAFIRTQPQLKVLNISGIKTITDDCLDTIVTSAPLLEELNLSGCDALTSVGAALLGTLNHLKKLDISQCSNIGTEGLTKGIAKEMNTHLRELRMGYLKLCEEGVKAVAQYLPELRILDLDHCVKGVTDESVQSIIQNLRWLRKLSLQDCEEITDCALTGISRLSLDVKSKENNSLENFYPPPAATIAEKEAYQGLAHGVKISLRSKAEEEIVRDANRKRAMLAAYEFNLNEKIEFEGYNISNLKGLREFNLKGCHKITDVSLKYGFNFLELRKLSLSYCQQVSVFGMQAMVLNCPAIEDLDLSDCYSINDKTIQIITTELKRLRTLHINGCSQLTDHSLDAILVNCKNLQTLSVHRCHRMYTDVEDRLGMLPSLRNLNIDNITSLDNLNIFRLKKNNF